MPLPAEFRRSARDCHMPVVRVAGCSMAARASSGSNPPKIRWRVGLVSSSTVIMIILHMICTEVLQHMSSLVINWYWGMRDSSGSHSLCTLLRELVQRGSGSRSIILLSFMSLLLPVIKTHTIITYLSQKLADVKISIFWELAPHRWEHEHYAHHSRFKSKSLRKRWNI